MSPNTSSICIGIVLAILVITMVVLLAQGCMRSQSISTATMARVATSDPNPSPAPAYPMKASAPTLPGAQMHASEKFENSFGSAVQNRSMSHVYSMQPKVARSTTVQNFGAMEKLSKVGNSHTLKDYMPNIPHAADPQTGIPTFTADKLRRALNLDSRSNHGYLRPTLRYNSGASKLGNRECSNASHEADMELQRKKFNAALMAGQEEPVLFGISEYMY